jgi:hypothetical protein
MLPVSNDTLLRVVRRRTRASSDPLKVVGIDDWAWRRNHRYASIVCNLEMRRIVTLLPDREPATAQAWFAAHPTIGIVARDRGGGYGEAAAKALPHAVQVADRWHLMENASRAFLDAVRKSMRQIRSAIGAMTIDPKLMCQRPKSGGTVLCLLPLKRLRFQPPAAFDLYRYPRTKKEQGEPTLAELVKKCLFLHKSKASPAGEPVQRPCYGRSRPSYRQAKPSTSDPGSA